MPIHSLSRMVMLLVLLLVLAVGVVVGVVVLSPTVVVVLTAPEAAFSRKKVLNFFQLFFSITCSD